MDLSEEANCRRAVEGATEVYNLAADMGGMGFIERNRVACLRSILINTHMVESAYRVGVERYFYSSSACAYNTDLQKDTHVRALGVGRVPRNGGARVRVGEAGLGDVLPGVLGGARHEDIHRPVHNVYGPNGTWDGGRASSTGWWSAMVPRELR